MYSFQITNTILKGFTLGRKSVRRTLAIKKLGRIHRGESITNYKDKRDVQDRPVLGKSVYL